MPWPVPPPDLATASPNSNSHPTGALVKLNDVQPQPPAAGTLGLDEPSTAPIRQRRRQIQLSVRMGCDKRELWREVLRHAMSLREPIEIWEQRFCAEPEDVVPTSVEGAL